MRQPTLNLVEAANQIAVAQGAAERGNADCTWADGAYKEFGPAGIGGRILPRCPYDPHDQNATRRIGACCLPPASSGARKHPAWFSGWAGDRDDDAQRYAITVLVGNGQSGGMVAAPLARMILADCLALPQNVADEKLMPERLAAAPGHVGKMETLDEK